VRQQSARVFVSTAIRIVVCEMPAARSASAPSSEWLVSAGQSTTVFVWPRLTCSPNAGSRQSKKRLNASIPIGSAPPAVPSKSIVKSGAGSPR